MDSAESFQTGSTTDSSENMPLFPNVRVLIPSHFRDKVAFLCKRINTIEWSGILFYRTQGEFGGENFHCILEDILLMDVGDTVYTSYRPHGLNIFQEKNPALRDCRKGHIHSHHKMNVWFSSTDQLELERNTKHHCFYLSVIVNNLGEMIGQFCYMADSVEKRSRTLSVRLSPTKQDFRVVFDDVLETQILCQHQCSFESYSTAIDEQFETRIQEIAAPPSEPAKLNAEGIEAVSTPKRKRTTAAQKTPLSPNKSSSTGKRKPGSLKKVRKAKAPKKSTPGVVKKIKK